MPTCDTANLSIVITSLVESGRRVIVPSLRGFGDTRLKANARRTGNSAMLALDAIALMDALDIDQFDVAGHDWGSNAAEALAAGWPDPRLRSPIHLPGEHIAVCSDVPCDQLG